MNRFSAKFTRTLVLGLAAAGALSACGAEDAPVIPGVEQVGVVQAEQALSAHLATVGNARAEFVRSSAFRDELGIEHTRFQQTVGGVPVFGGEAIVHRSPLGEE